MGKYIGRKQAHAMKRALAKPIVSSVKNLLPEGPCPYCGVQMSRYDFLRQPTRDHVVPKRLGGHQTLIVCYECNNQKGGMAPGEWLWCVREMFPARLEIVTAIFREAGITDLRIRQAPPQPLVTSWKS